jgi:hypothetical protein
LVRDFTHALLSAVGEIDDSALRPALDRLGEADLLIAEGAGPQANYRFKHALIQDAAYDSLLKSRRQTLHRRAAEILVGQPERAAAEPEVIAYHFAEAGLDDPAIEWWGKAGDQALRRSAFQEAIAHLGKAIAVADKAAGAATTTIIPEAKTSRRVKLQTDYWQAVMWSKGLAADETKAALDRIAAAAQDPAERLAGYYGRWARSHIRGEMRSAREIAASFLREAEAEGRITEAGVAHRVLGLTCTMQGELPNARAHFERATCDYIPDRDQESRFRFGGDNGIVAAAQLAWPLWFQGEVERARQLVELAIRDAVDSGHIATLAQVLASTMFGGYRHDADATLRAGERLVRLAREHGIETHAAIGEVYASWARGRLGDPASGALNTRKALEAYIGQGNRLFAPYFYGLRAELEAATVGADLALRSIDEGLALAQETGEHISDSFLHRLRGDILLKRNPADPTPAEDAYCIAVAVAKQQGARSYELLASLWLAKLYQATSRPADARAVLEPALEGFAPTPEMPEIAEAQALLEQL